MRLSIISFNTHNINDGTNYLAYFPAGSVMLQRQTEAFEVERPSNAPVYATQHILAGHTIPVFVIMLGTITTQIDTLKLWFDTTDNTPHKLLVKDLDNSNKEWYVYGKTIDQPQIKGQEVKFMLSVSDPIWYEESESSASWSISAGSDTKAITTVGGNHNAKPRFTLTPTSAGGTGFAYKKFITIRNRVINPLSNYPLDITLGGWDTAALCSYATNHAHINAGAGISAVLATIPYEDMDGTLPSSGMGMMEAEQFSYTGKTGTTDGNLTGCTRGINGTTGATHADHVTIYQSKIQADGDDIRIYMDGKEINRWLNGINTATTRVWISQNWKPKQDLTLGVAIANAGALTDITFQWTAANLAAIKGLPPQGILQIGTELLRYSAVIINYPLRVTGITRGAYGTTAAAHTTVGTAINWIEHEIWCYYSNQTIDAPETDDTHKPILNLATPSTNTSWDYDEFRDDAGLRAGAWRPSLLGSANTKDPVNKSNYYTGVRTLNADPATEMGTSIYAWLAGATWRADTAYIIWQLYQPCGVTTVTAVGEVYRYTTSWPILATCRKCNNGLSWVNAWTTEATPASAQTWTACAAHNAVALGATYNYLQFIFYGSQASTASNVAHYSQTDVLLVLDSTLVPTGTFGAEQNNYHLQAKITNNTTGEWLQLNWGMALNETITVDCENKVIYDTDNANGVGAITFSSVRTNWLDLLPGVTNTLQFDDTGTVGLTLVTYWRDRNA